MSELEDKVKEIEDKVDELARKGNAIVDEKVEPFMDKYGKKIMIGMAAAFGIGIVLIMLFN